MKIALLLVAITEVLGGVVAYLYPEYIFNVQDALQSRMYGLAAFVIGLVSFYCYKYFSEEKLNRTLYLIVMFFQGALALICSQDQNDILVHETGAVITHLVLFTIMVAGYLKDIKKEEA